MNNHFLYKNCQVRQANNVIPVIKDFLITVKPSQVLEIGTFTGGLTLILRNLLDEIGMVNVPLRSYDTHNFLNNQELIGHIQNGRIEFIQKNMWPDLVNLKDVDEASEFIQRSGPTIVFCDGGNKPREFRTLSPLLKKGDHILGHDYAPNKDYFEEHIKGKIWDWHELEDSHINEAVEKNDLLPFMEEEFRKVVWVSKQRG